MQLPEILKEKRILVTKDCLSLECLHLFRDLTCLVLKLEAIQGHIFLYGIHHSLQCRFFSFSFPFKTLSLIAQSRSELQGREGNVLFCRSKFAFVGERNSAERNKNEAFSAALKMPSKKKKKIFLSSLQVYNTWILFFPARLGSLKLWSYDILTSKEPLRCSHLCSCFPAEQREWSPGWRLHSWSTEVFVRCRGRLAGYL